ncbi:MAG: gliding motility lipoprotein GldB, partial [Flavobacteriales bacterium]|nr:gliding motility lipoprotein GldB [Flavobacteriales bacterium]
RIWAHLVDNELLYTTDKMLVNKWVNQAPFIAGIPKQSPGRLGQWVGWQIVRNYMKESPEVTIQNLMDNQNAQEIFTRSKYKPKI